MGNGDASCERNSTTKLLVVQISKSNEKSKEIIDLLEKKKEEFSPFLKENLKTLLEKEELSSEPYFNSNQEDIDAWKGATRGKGQEKTSASGDVVEENEKDKSYPVLVAFVACGDKEIEKCSNKVRYIEELYLSYGMVLIESKKERLEIYPLVCRCFKRGNTDNGSIIIDKFERMLQLDPDSDFRLNDGTNQRRFINIETAPSIIEPIKAIIDQNSFLPNSEKQDDKQEIFHRQYRQEAEYEIRGEYQIDYERIINSTAYRRTVDKAQVFSSSKGAHYRTRMTHTQQVAQIARALARGLIKRDLITDDVYREGLIDLTEAIALAHDLGHTPFGHQGEYALNDILRGKDSRKIIEKIGESKRRGEEPSKSSKDYYGKTQNYYGGFKHNFHGLRVVSYLEERYFAFHGLNLTYKVLEGILKHTKAENRECENCSLNNEDLNACLSKRCCSLEEFLPSLQQDKMQLKKKYATTISGQIVAIADEIAQRSHDIDDAFASGILSNEDFFDLISLTKFRKLYEHVYKEKVEHDAQGMNRLYIDGDELLSYRISSGIVSFLLRDVISKSEEKIKELKKSSLSTFSLDNLQEKVIRFSPEGSEANEYLEKIVTNLLINSPEIIINDTKGYKIVQDLFEAYYRQPGLLSDSTLNRMRAEMLRDTYEAIDFRKDDKKVIEKELQRIHIAFAFEKRENGSRPTKNNREMSYEEIYSKKKKCLVRAITDYIAGMTDSHAIQKHREIYNI